MTRILLSLLIFPVVVCISYFDLPAQQQAGDEEGARKVFEEIDERRSKVNYEIARLEMVIYDPRGRTRTRVIQSYSYNDEGNSNTLMIFESPGSVRGTGFLTINENGNEVQRLYLPELGRIQTISPAERGDRFMGSDFTYEDLGVQDPDDYEFLGMESGDNYFRIQARNLMSEQYDQLNFTIQSETYAVEKVEYYNEEGEIIKRLEAEQFENLYENLWSPGKMIMYDLQEDRKTELMWTNRTINDPIPEWRFSERGLRRGLN